MKNHFFKFYLLLLLIPIFHGCKKDITGKLPTETNPEVSGKRKISTNSITPYLFDWEVGDYMPTPSGVTILKPWASGSNQSFPQIYTTDIKKTDGWELVYNTFSSANFSQPAYFVLYNRYRGLLRTYFYLTPTTPVASSYISHTLIQRTLGNDAPDLTFTGKNAVDLSVMNEATELIQQYKTTATGTWYAAEFEMVYDPNVKNKSASTNTMVWQINNINVSDVSINGSSQGGINGTIAQPKSPSPSLFSSLIQGALDFAGFKALSSIIFKAKDPHTGQDQTQLATQTLVNALKDATKAGLNGQAKNVVNGIFGGASGAGSDSTKQYVHLTTNTSYSLTGSISDISELANPSMIIPGSKDQTTVTGYVPLYTKALGLMTLSAAPTATLQSYDDDFFNMKLNTGSYSIIWNPDIINSSVNGATIKNIKQEIISYENYYANENYSNGYVSSMGYGPWPLNLTETDGLNTYLKDDLAVSNTIKLEQRILFESDAGITLQVVDNLVDGQKLPKHVLRITFDVVPNSGSPKITIVKSFNILYKGPKIYM
ncbi:MAG: hypothetical protein V4456_11915 [Bacteroidota bacterium]